MTKPVDRVSIVIPTHNEGENLVDTVRCVLKNTCHPDLEIIVVDDGSTDGSGDRLAEAVGHDRRVGVLRAEGLGVARARNLGATYASGAILVFLDAHCFTPPHWMDGLIQPFVRPRVGMVGPAVATMRYGSEVRGCGLSWRDASLTFQWLEQRGNTPYPVPLLTGSCQAVRKAAFEGPGPYDPGMTRWGSEDEELSLRCWLMGYDVLVQPQSVVYHLFRDSFPYEVLVPKILYNRLRLATLHLSDARLERVLDYYRNAPGFDETMGRLRHSDALRRRRQLQELRCRDDDWFCRHFGCQI